MFNPEKLIRGMLSQAIGGGFGKTHRRSNSPFSPGKASVITGLLGLGMAAFEHFKNQNSGPTSPPCLAGSFPTNGAPPPPPPPPASFSSTLLIQAMIAAAHADGHLDAQEQSELRKSMFTADLSAEERQFLEGLFNAPPTLQSIVAEVRTPEQAERVYVASLLAISVDTEAERQYLKQLAAGLRLTTQQVLRLHEELGVTQQGEIL